MPSFIKGIVSRDRGGLLLGSVHRYLVLDVPATYLFLILISSSYVKFYICLLVCIPPPRRRVTHGGGIRRPQAQSSMDHPLFRSAQNPWDCRLQASPPHPAGAALAGVPAQHKRTSGCPLTTVNFSLFLRYQKIRSGSCLWCAWAAQKYF
jgi:hypothetical protein